uniref:WD_REPEATS_REGION domain-containing protein n=1 Tax=Panagrellus redivivus TaxID=6233 RepID=A0A7E4ZRE9_PANRE
MSLADDDVAGLPDIIIAAESHLIVSVGDFHVTNQFELLGNKDHIMTASPKLTHVARFLNDEELVVFEFVPPRQFHPVGQIRHVKASAVSTMTVTDLAGVYFVEKTLPKVIQGFKLNDELRSLSGGSSRFNHASAISKVVPFPNPEVIASLSRDGLVRLWRVSSVFRHQFHSPHKYRFTDKRRLNAPQSVTFFDGTMVTGHYDGSVVYRPNRESPKNIVTVPRPRGFISAVVSVAINASKSVVCTVSEEVCHLRKICKTENHVQLEFDHPKGVVRFKSFFAVWGRDAGRGKIAFFRATEPILVDPVAEFVYDQHTPKTVTHNGSHFFVFLNDGTLHGFQLSCRAGLQVEVARKRTSTMTSVSSQEGTWFELSSGSGSSATSGPSTAPKPSNTRPSSEPSSSVTPPSRSKDSSDPLASTSDYEYIDDLLEKTIKPPPRQPVEAAKKSPSMRPVSAADSLASVFDFAPSAPIGRHAEPIRINLKPRLSVTSSAAPSQPSPSVSLGEVLLTQAFFELPPPPPRYAATQLPSQSESQQPSQVDEFHTFALNQDQLALSSISLPSPGNPVSKKR